MEAFRETLLILVSTPLYAVVIGAEIIFSYTHHHKRYSTKGTVENIYLMLLNMGLDILMRGFNLFLLTYLLQYKFFTIENVYLYWAALLIAEDFMFYWLHRVDHYCRFFWAVHVTHHSSEEFNLTVGFRSSVFQPLYRFMYFIPIAMLGFDPMDILFAYSATQIFGILVHTQTVGKLGFLEYFLVTPSHHRVHHGSNVRYLDKNMGMFLIIWDKLFGTFQAEEDSDPVKYGLTTNLKSYHPLTMVFHEWRNMARDMAKPVSFKQKLLYVFGPPGWSHDGSTKTSAQLRSELNSTQTSHGHKQGH